MATYDVLKKEADERQDSLTNGKIPWIRIGTEVHARAAGAIDVFTFVSDGTYMYDLSLDHKTLLESEINGNTKKY